MNVDRARKAQAAGIPLLATWATTYLWGWLAGLVGIALGSYLAWLMPKEDGPDVIGLHEWGDRGSALAGLLMFVAVVAVVLLWAFGAL